MSVSAVYPNEPYPIGEGKHESFTRAALRDVLKDHWSIEEEVWGSGPGGVPLRADAVIRPVDASKWKDPDVAFVVECKAAERHTQLRDRSHWLRQCVDYGYTNWTGYGYRCVLTFPSVFGDFRRSDPQIERHVFGAMGVGEIIQDRWSGWSIYLSGHRIWSVKDGISDGRNWTCRKRFGG